MDSTQLLAAITGYLMTIVRGKKPVKQRRSLLAMRLSQHQPSCQHKRSKTPPTIKALRSQQERVGRSVAVAARLDGKSCCSDIDEKANSFSALIACFMPVFDSSANIRYRLPCRTRLQVAKGAVSTAPTSKESMVRSVCDPGLAVQSRRCWA